MGAIGRSCTLLHHIVCLIIAFLFGFKILLLLTNDILFICRSQVSATSTKQSRNLLFMGTFKHIFINFIYYVVINNFYDVDFNNVYKFLYSILYTAPITMTMSGITLERGETSIKTVQLLVYLKQSTPTQNLESGEKTKFFLQANCFLHFWLIIRYIYY